MREELAECEQDRVARRRNRIADRIRVLLARRVLDDVHRRLIQISMQLIFELRELDAERFLDRARSRLFVREQRHERAELFVAFRVAEHQIVHEQPRLRVEIARSILLGIGGRIEVDGEEARQWNHPARLQPLQMFRNRRYDAQLVAAVRLKCRVELGDPFAEPERQPILQRRDAQPAET